MRPVKCLAQNLFSSPPRLSQIVAEAAFVFEAELGENVARYRRSRDHLLRALPKAGFSRLSPPRARSTCSPTSPTGRTPARRSVLGCWPRPRRRQAPAWISTERTAGGSCGSAIAVRKPHAQGGGAAESLAVGGRGPPSFDVPLPAEPARDLT